MTDSVDPTSLASLELRRARRLLIGYLVYVVAIGLMPWSDPKIRKDHAWGDFAQWKLAVAVAIGFAFPVGGWLLRKRIARRLGVRGMGSAQPASLSTLETLVQGGAGALNSMYAILLLHRGVPLTVYGIVLATGVVAVALAWPRADAWHRDFRGPRIGGP